MSQARKTFNVADLLWKVNFFLKNSKPEQVAERKNEHALMGNILQSTGNYKGFGYLEAKFTDPSAVDFGDESRTFFYVASLLKEDYDAAEKRHRKMFE
jgi:hypothetical protein